MTHNISRITHGEPPFPDSYFVCFVYFVYEPKITGRESEGFRAHEALASLV